MLSDEELRSIARAERVRAAVAEYIRGWYKVAVSPEALVGEMAPIWEAEFRAIEARRPSPVTREALAKAWYAVDDDEWEFGVKTGVLTEVEEEPTEAQIAKAREMGWRVLRRRPGIEPGPWVPLEKGAEQ